MTLSYFGFDREGSERLNNSTRSIDSKSSPFRKMCPEIIKAAEIILANGNTHTHTHTHTQIQRYNSYHQRAHRIIRETKKPPVMVVIFSDIYVHRILITAEMTRIQIFNG